MFLLARRPPGHFVEYEPLVCSDDAEAIEKAKRLLIDPDIEFGAAYGRKAASVGSPAT
jgi:hypothetical protein